MMPKQMANLLKPKEASLVDLDKQIKVTKIKTKVRKTRSSNHSTPVVPSLTRKTRSNPGLKLLRVGLWLQNR